MSWIDPTVCTVVTFPPADLSEDTEDPEPSVEAEVEILIGAPMRPAAARAFLRAERLCLVRGLCQFVGRVNLVALGKGEPC